MDINTIIQMIGSVGFPIVACCYMAYSAERQSARHAEESKAMTDALTDLKLAINTLIERLN